MTTKENVMLGCSEDDFHKTIFQFAGQDFAISDRLLRGFDNMFNCVFGLSGPLRPDFIRCERFDIGVIQGGMKTDLLKIGGMPPTLLDHWIFYVDVPKCFVKLDVRKKNFRLNDKLVETTEMDWTTKELKKGVIWPTPEIKFLNRFVMVTEYIYGPKPGDDSCKGKENWNGYLHEENPENFAQKVKDWLSFSWMFSK